MSKERPAKADFSINRSERPEGIVCPAAIWREDWTPPRRCDGVTRGCGIACDWWMHKACKEKYERDGPWEPGEDG